jgi:hypothetical protein
MFSNFATELQAGDQRPCRIEGPWMHIYNCAVQLSKLEKCSFKHGVAVISGLGVLWAVLQQEIEHECCH